MKILFLLLISMNCLGQHDCEGKYSALLHLTHFMKPDKKMIRKEGREAYKKVINEFIQANLEPEAPEVTKASEGPMFISAIDTMLIISKPVCIRAIDSLLAQPKTDTVKGWVHYYSIDTLVRDWPWKIVDIDDLPDGRHVALVEHGRRAIAIYKYEEEEVPCMNRFDNNPPCYQKIINDGIWWYHKVMQRNFWKILVNGKAFDLSKEHQFIPDDKIVK
jgi:hypothetical protein